MTEKLREALLRVSANYRRTLAGLPVCDADECLAAAEAALAAPVAEPPEPAPDTFDADYWRAVCDGSWPNADEVITHMREKRLLAAKDGALNQQEQNHG